MLAILLLAILGVVRRGWSFVLVVIVVVAVVVVTVVIVVIVVIIVVIIVVVIIIFVFVLIIVAIVIAMIDTTSTLADTMTLIKAVAGAVGVIAAHALVALAPVSMRLVPGGRVSTTLYSVLLGDTGAVAKLDSNEPTSSTSPSSPLTLGRGYNLEGSNPSILGRCHSGPDPAHANSCHSHWSI